MHNLVQGCWMKSRERSGFTSDFGPARFEWTGDRTDSMTDRAPI